MTPVYATPKKVSLIEKIIKRNALPLAWCVAGVVLVSPVVWEYYGPVKAWVEGISTTKAKVDDMGPKVDKLVTDMSWVRGYLEGKEKVALREERVAARGIVPPAN